MNMKGVLLSLRKTVERRYRSSNTWIYVSLYGAFQHSPPLTSFTTQKTVFQRPLQQTGEATIAQECAHLQNLVGVWAEWRVCFEKSRGKFPCPSACHCSVSLKAHACGWKTKPAELCLSVPMEKYPPADRPTVRPTVYLQGGSHIRKMLTYREHINSPAGSQTEIHFGRQLLYV